MVVDHRREQIVRGRDGVEIAGEMEIDVVHGADLRTATARRAALHAEAWTKRGLAQAEHRLAAGAVQRIGQAHGRSGLAFTRRRRVDRRDEDQLAARFLGQTVEVELGLVAAIGFERVLVQAQPLGDPGNGLQRGRAGDL